MVIEIVSFPMKNKVMFHSFLYVYQRVDLENPPFVIRLDQGFLQGFSRSMLVYRDK